MKFCLVAWSELIYLYVLLGVRSYLLLLLLKSEIHHEFSPKGYYTGITLMAFDVRSCTAQADLRVHFPNCDKVL